MDFRLLGTLEMRSTNTYSTIESSRHRKLLAALLIGANSPISVERLVDVIWGETPPATARQQVQNCVGSLRRRITGMGREANIFRSSTAYVLEIPDNLVDARVFGESCGHADRLMRQGETRQAADTFRAALRLWRGKALQDVDSEALLADALQLEEIRLRAVESLVDLEFSAGRKVAMIAELRAWSLTYPYHEALHCQLADALVAASRKAEALQLVRALRQRLRDELGVDVSRRTQELERRLRYGDTGRAAQPNAAATVGAANVEVGDVRVNRQTLQAISHTLGRLSSTLNLLLADPRFAGNEPGSAPPR